MMQFYERLSNKLVIYDPLNRPILNDDEEDMGTTRDDLIKEINEMDQLNPNDLDIMISPDNQDLLEDLFEKKDKEVKTIYDEMQKEAQSE